MEGPKLCALRAAGLVVEGQYPDIRSVQVSTHGQSFELNVRPLVARRGDITVLRPVEEQKIGFQSEQTLIEN